MRMYDIIMKKRNGGKLTSEEINFFISKYTSDEIPDYQAAALMMAVYFKGMDKEETASLTMAMAQSGDILKLDGIKGIKVDKHSTGGVGDKTSLVLIPMVAAAGVPVAKMSGRGLGHTGGTIDKLESFPGFLTALPEKEFIDNVNSIGVALAGQTANLAPADKKLYALRDVTATVESIPLIAASIMSKKIASGADAIVLDVKTGKGAFMKTTENSIALAREMTDIGNSLGRKTIAIVSGMDEPLGYAVGNSLEVIEAIDTLNGRGPQDLTELCLELGAYMLVLAGRTYDITEAKKILNNTLKNGTALKKLAELVKMQHGDEYSVYNTELLPKAEYVKEIISDREGFITDMECEKIGVCSMLLGGGRENKDSVIDLASGIMLKKKTGDYVKKGEAVAVLYTNNEAKLTEAEALFASSYTTGLSKPEKKPLIRYVVTGSELISY